MGQSHPHTRRMGYGIWIPVLIFIGGVLLADASRADELATIQIEGASATATFAVDGYILGNPSSGGEPKPVVVKPGDHVIEVREGERVVLRKEISLKPGEVKTLRVPKGD